MEQDPSEAPNLRRDPARIALVAMILLYAALVLRTAWVSDDAYISLRMVDNLLAGRGFVWNAGERVLAATNPLWMLLLAPFMGASGEEYASTLALGALCSGGTLWLLVRGASSTWAAALAVGVIALSRAMVDYSTSGLENPLTWLLLAVFVTLWSRPERGPRDLLGLTGVAALSVVNRMDVALLFAPAVAHRLWRERSRAALVQVLLGSLPFLAWEAFSLLYYGFPFPNTAYAKLNTDLPAAHLAQQGLRYYQWTLTRDPLTLVATLAAGAWALWRAPRTWPLLVGALLYLVYVVRIGGDFMGGRFFTAPLLLCLLAASRAPAPPRPGVVLGLVLALGVPFGVTGALARYGSEEEYAAEGKVRSKELIWSGIADERLWHSENHALWSEDRREEAKGGHKAPDEPTVAVSGGVGLSGFRGGPNLHLVDVCGLGDPLLARLPAVGFRDLRPGHYYRVLPGGYLETLEEGEPRFEDPDVATFYERLSLVTRGPLLSGERLREILRFNLGGNDALIDRERYRRPPVERLSQDELRRRLRAGSLIVPPQGLNLSLGAKRTAPTIQIQLQGSEDFVINLLRGDKILTRGKVQGAHGDGEGLVWRTVEVTDKALDGYDGLHVEPARLDDDQRSVMGQVRLGGAEEGNGPSE